MLVTALPSEAQDHRYPAWLDSAETKPVSLPMVIWHDPHQEISHLKKVATAHRLQWVSRNPLWHQETIDGLAQHWPPMAQSAYRDSLQAVGLLHDTSISTQVPSDTLVWVAPEWLIEHGHDESAWQWLMNMAAIIDEAAFSLAHSSVVHAKTPTGRGADVICVKAQFLPRLNAMYWHAYDESIQRGEVPIASQVLKQLAATQPGRMHWFSSPDVGETSQPSMRWCSYQSLPNV